MVKVVLQKEIERTEAVQIVYPDQVETQVRKGKVHPVHKVRH